MFRRVLKSHPEDRADRSLTTGQPEGVAPGLSVPLCAESRALRAWGWRRRSVPAIAGQFDGDRGEHIGVWDSMSGGAALGVAAGSGTLTPTARVYVPRISRAETPTPGSTGRVVITDVFYERREGARGTRRAGPPVHVPQPGDGARPGVPRVHRRGTPGVVRFELRERLGDLEQRRGLRASAG